MIFIIQDTGDVFGSGDPGGVGVPRRGGLIMLNRTIKIR
jgi:hypothetical protein